MDFFAHQDEARKKTGQLVALFVAAVIAVVVATYLAVAAVLAFTNAPETLTEEALAGTARPSTFWDLVLRPDLMLSVGGATLTVIVLGSLYKLFQLRSGGTAVAQSLGADFVSLSTTDTGERRLLNVVEEMAIASGIPMPQVCVLGEDQNINAFAAGFSPETAVIGVTRGTLERLSRDELQGVIAHEFSHILNGDMRLNIRLMGVLHGILVIGLIGQGVLRTVFRTGGTRRSSSKKGDGGGVIAIAAVALALMIIGYVGTFFGNLIKAAVSRQREFLADASAVQFTRNPNGIGGALKRIAEGGSAVISSANAPAASHMFFGDALKPRLFSLMATHPPLAERVARIEGAYSAEAMKERAGGRTAPGSGASPGAAGVTAGFAGAAEGSAVAAIGAPRVEHMDHASALLRSLPQVVRASATEPFTARAVVYATLLDASADVRPRQLAALERALDPGTYAQLLRLAEPTLALSKEAHLALVDLAVPALRTLSDAQYMAFRSHVAALIAADNRIDLFEWMLERVLLRHVAPAFSKRQASHVRHHSLGSVAGELAVLLSTLARIGSRSEQQAEHALTAAEPHTALRLTLLGAAECSLPALNAAIDQLDESAPTVKRQVISAAAAVIGADGNVTPEEAQLLRAVSDSLGCPMPPVLAGQALVA